MMGKSKYDTLLSYLKSLHRVAIAYSGGVDSTFLLKAAFDALGENVVAITARSLSFPQRELNDAIKFATELGVEHIVIDSEELELEGFAQNPKNRCYLCKKELFTKIQTIAKTKNIEHIIEGSNLDDNGDYRPGLLAIKELGIESPLREVGLTKDDIREISKELALPTWNKPSFACLASRFPYGDTISPEKLKMIDQAEQFLLDRGFYQVRVRVHNNLARIETDETGFALLQKQETRKEIYKQLKTIGFTYVALDLNGYRIGSMNETLTEK